MTQIADLIEIKPQVLEFGFTVDWPQLAMLQKVLEPLSLFTVQLQSEQYTAGQYAMHVLQCESRLGRIVRKEIQYADDAQRMLEILRKRSMAVTKSMHFAAAVYLDPRFVHKSVTYFTKEELTGIVVSFHHQMQSTI